MNNTKFIIDNKTNLTDRQVFLRIAEVMGMGLVSGNNDDLYCYITRFKDNVMVAFDKKKYGYKIYVWKDKVVE